MPKAGPTFQPITTAMRMTVSATSCVVGGPSSDSCRSTRSCTTRCVCPGRSTSHRTASEPRLTKAASGAAADEGRERRRGDEPEDEIELRPGLLRHQAEGEKVRARSVEEHVEQRHGADEGGKAEEGALGAAVL